MRPGTSGARKGGARGGAAGQSGAGHQRKGGAVARAAPTGEEQHPAALRDPDEDDTNAGFGKYLRSQEGIEMMKLFVIANTIVVFMTMAWPQMQQSYQILRSLMFPEDEYEEDL